MMKNSKPLFFYLIIGIFIIFSGCVHPDQNEKFPDPSSAPPVVTTPAQLDSLQSPMITRPVTDSNTPGPQNPGIAGNSTIHITTISPKLMVNYTEIPFIGQTDISNPVDETRKNAIAQAALADDRVRDLLIDGGRIEGVLFQCHPTPKDISENACAPALRIFHKGINWDFLVDEKNHAVIFVQRDTPPLPTSEIPITLQQDDAIGIALNDSEVRNYLQNGYTIKKTGPLCYEQSLSDRQIYKSYFTGVEIETDTVYLIAYVDGEKRKVNKTVTINIRNPVVAGPVPATPFIAIDPSRTHTTGEEFFINGTTNLAASNESLLLQIGTAEFNPGGFGSSFYTANISVQREDNGENVWSAEVLPSRWQMYTKPPNYYPTPTFEPAGPGKYQVVVSSKNPLGPDIIATQQLILVSSETGNNPDSVQPVVPSKNFTGIPEFSVTTPRPTTAQSASDMAVPGIALGISVVAAAGSWKKKE